MGDKAVFESRDLSAPFQRKSADGDKTYLGVERRRADRRSGHDRRESVRFDNGVSSERRENPGRREDDKTLRFW